MTFLLRGPGFVPEPSVSIYAHLCSSVFICGAHLVLCAGHPELTSMGAADIARCGAGRRNAARMAIFTSRSALNGVEVHL